MPIDINGNLDLNALDADAVAMLDDLQPNIVKAHVRNHCHVLVLRFDPNQPAEARTYIRALAGLMKSAQAHLAEVKAFRESGTSGTPLLAVYISASGYRALGIPDARIPADAAFRAGMRQRGPALGDPPAPLWDEAYRGDVHALLLIGGAAKPAAAKRATNRLKDRVLQLMPSAVSVSGTPELGEGMESRLAQGEGIEHFGYVDGRSQPLFFEQEIAEQRDRRDGIDIWSPRFPLSQVLVRDPGGIGADRSFGSYFVFRKLEQNVRAFKDREAQLADALGLVGGDRKRAGAMVVGRFEDGTPLTMQRSDGANDPVPNNFGYAGDDEGLRCPFHAHVRKTNPRGDSVREFGVSDVAERGHIMARRGVTYGGRRRHPNSRNLQRQDLPTGEVGLLFMAYMQNVANQFEFTQDSWANSPNFVRQATGLDGVMGQGGAGQQTYRATWGDPASQTKMFDFTGFVTLKGGEYFFAPSLSFLRNL